MKTAIQELIEDLQDMCPDYYNNNYSYNNINSFFVQNL